MSGNYKDRPPITADDRTVIMELYRQGLSTRAVAKLTGVSYGYIGKIVKDAGISRNRLDAVRMVSVFSDTTHWRSCRAQARKIMERALGRKLERWEHVHHINHDYTDRRPENLAVLNASDHMKHHHPKNPIPRGQRLERAAYQKRYFEAARNVGKLCEECNKQFFATKYDDRRFCGNKCAQTFRWKVRRASKA